MSTETIRLIRDGEKGVWRWGKREIIYLSLHCHHQNDSCIKMGSDESHFIVSFIVRDKFTRRCLWIATFWRERRAKADSNQGPSAYQPNAILLGQTSSQISILVFSLIPAESDLFSHWSSAFYVQKIDRCWVILRVLKHQKSFCLVF